MTWTSLYETGWPKKADLHFGSPATGLTGLVGEWSYLAKTATNYGLRPREIERAVTVGWAAAGRTRAKAKMTDRPRIHNNLAACVRFS